MFENTKSKLILYLYLTVIIINSINIISSTTDARRHVLIYNHNYRNS